MSDAGLRVRNPALQYNPNMRGGLDQGAPASAQYYVDFYTYVVNIPTLAAGGTSAQNIQVQADSDFEWIETTVSADLVGNAMPWTDQLIIPVSVQITDGGSGRQLLSAPTPISAIGGNGKQPFILPESRVFKARTNIQLTFVNFSATGYENIYFNLIGRKIFKFGPGTR